MSGPFVTIFAWLLLLCAAFCSACGRRGAETGRASVPAVTGVSRVIIPANGGQTIRMPRLMGDAHTLWSPLSAREKQQSSAAFRGAADGSASAMAAWLPSTEHDTMRRYLFRLTHERRDVAQKALARAEQYMPIVREGVRKHGLPPEIACLPLVESAFEPQAVSPAGAAGLWQLMPATARRYGLTVTDAVDERFDVQKSTDAATAYLASLYRMFGDWPLALAAYNCGEGAMQNALGQSGCSDLDGLTRHCRQVEAGPLREETLRFVPQFAAAVALMSQAGTLGFSFAPSADAAPRAVPAPRAQRPERLTLSGGYSEQDAPVAIPRRSERIR